MGLLILGKFSDENAKILNEGFTNGTFTTEEGEDYDGALSEKGRAGLIYSIDLWKPLDRAKSAELQNIIDEIFEQEEDEELGYKISVDKVRRISILLKELHQRLPEYTIYGTDIRPERLNELRELIPDVIKNAEVDTGVFKEVIEEPIWHSDDARIYFEVAARLGREIWIN